MRFVYAFVTFLVFTCVCSALAGLVGEQIGAPYSVATEILSATPATDSACKIHGVVFDNREELLYASITENGEAQTYVWSFNFFNLERPELVEVLPYTMDKFYAEVSTTAMFEVFLAIADDDEVIFVILGNKEDDIRYDLSVCMHG